jgi:1-acyl-sn-glycerol-3-phosphate acyltransferase
MVFFILGPVRSHGRERVPASGGVLILANHLADCDPPVVQLACPRPIRFMAKSDLFGIPVLGRFIRWTGAFPVKRGEPDRNALKRAAELLKRGEAVCIFPEGQLSEDGALQELKPGVALVVRMAGTPVVCCSLSNTNRIMPYGTLVPRPSWQTTDVRWGEPRTFSKHDSAEEIMNWAEAQLRSLSAE